jgi:hypothetical protein
MHSLPSALDTRESWRTRFIRYGFNLFPAFRASGGRLTHISADFRHIRVKLALSWLTRNYVGTIYGGSMYAAVDPIYMVMLIKILGPAYVVWDKAATIRFHRPGRSTLFAEFFLSEDDLRGIREELATREKCDRTYRIELKDKYGVVHATVEKLLHIRNRQRS